MLALAATAFNASRITANCSPSGSHTVFPSHWCEKKTTARLPVPAHE